MTSIVAPPVRSSPVAREHPQHLEQEQARETMVSERLLEGYRENGELAAAVRTQPASMSYPQTAQASEHSLTEKRLGSAIAARRRR
mmetsp:Transcript_31725/g.84690  ORF Transcript_31725/g.84690 Transcript_31725/m.84690 type:complete len:86 (+) Transcript_31725:1978-2235(+)